MVTGPPRLPPKVLNRLGGPVTIPKLYNGKDKTFFFLDYEGNRKRTSQPEQYLVPTAAERSGNLSDLSLPNNVLIDPLNGKPFPNNTIPSSRLNSSAMTLLNNYYPLPNAAGGDGYNYEKLQTIPSKTDGADPNDPDSSSADAALETDG